MMLTWAINEGAKARQQGKTLRCNPYNYTEQYGEAVSWQWGFENA